MWVKFAEQLCLFVKILEKKVQFQLNPNSFLSLYKHSMLEVSV